MNYFWHKGPLFVKELLDFYDEPKPHFNTLSTIVRGLEEKGYVSHKAYGKTYQYFAVVSEESFKKRTLRQVIRKYFNSSYLGIVSSLIEEEDISLKELKELIEKVEKGNAEQYPITTNGRILCLYIKRLCLSSHSVSVLQYIAK